MEQCRQTIIAMTVASYCATEPKLATIWRQ